MAEPARVKDASFDLRDPAISIRECPSCDEPVAARIEGENTTTTCGYCNAPVTFAAHSAPQFEGAQAFRGAAPRGAAGTRLPMTLAEPPASLGKVQTATEVHTAWRSAKHALPEKGSAAEGEHDYVLLWLANKESEFHLRAQDYVRTRAVLETSLTLVTLPHYRAILLARLSRLASRGNALDLAKRWLELCPTSIRVTEIASEVRLAQGLYEHKRGDAQGVLDALGEDDAADTSAGALRPLSVALRVDALERLGKSAAAHAVWLNASRTGSVTLSRVAKYYGLAPLTQVRVLRRGAIALVLVMAAVISAIEVMRSLKPGGSSPAAALLVFIGILVAAIFFHRSRPQRS